MKNEIIYDGITEIRSDIIERSELYQFNRKINWAKWLTMVASVCLLVGVGIYTQVTSAANKYMGPVLPLTTLSETDGILVERNINLDFTPYREVESKYDKVVRVHDEYILVNESDEDIYMTLIYGFIGTLVDDIEIIPEIYYDGKMCETEVYLGEALSDYDNWKAYEKLLSNPNYLEKALCIPESAEPLNTIERDKKFQAYKVLSRVSDEMLYKIMKEENYGSDIYHSERVMYVTYDIVIPAEQSITLNINMDKRGCNETYEIMTTLGSVFEFSKQTAKVTNFETVHIVDDNFGFQIEKENNQVELEMIKPCYSISVEKTDENIWKTLRKQGYNVVPKLKEESMECMILDHRAFVNVYEIDKEYFQKYLNKCVKKFGFDIDLEQTDQSLKAYNSKGYYLWLEFIDNSMLVWIEKPIEFGKYEFPTIAFEQNLPTPKSDLGSYRWKNSQDFCLYVKASQEEYLLYVEACKVAGFKENVVESDNNFYALNENGYMIHIIYEGNNTYSIIFENIL